MDRIQAATEVFSYKWHPVIIYTAYRLDGASYSEFDATLDEISSKMLSSGLSDLRERNILATTEAVEGSGRTVYRLTDKGRALIPVIDILQAWEQRHDEACPSVLIVEDERMVATILSEYFSDSYDIQHVRSGEAALERYTDDTDIVILDRRLKGMSGDDVAANLKTRQGGATILAVSGMEPDDDIARLPVDDYVHKPVEEDELKSRVELLLGRAELDNPARTYLSLRSKQLALVETCGEAATEMQGYRRCATRIEELAVSSHRQETLERLLPSSAGEFLSSVE